MCIRDRPSTAPLGKPIEDKKQLTEKLSDALDALLHHSAAVSYTHLDVYKRQSNGTILLAITLVDE